MVNIYFVREKKLDQVMRCIWCSTKLQQKCPFVGTTTFSFSSTSFFCFLHFFETTKVNAKVKNLSCLSRR